ncbi:hypothetical protein GJW-30_1_02677 [Variibacter gotjawalensis]|uniref:Uncharacterized protein n=1 Tax=Variibacter gotjawalensis TaxID=1333996 RepID=A0A0S3PW11_9BRAD|nr:hypothetical protein [Variibacter gotjawalensis]NIK45967.1 hypothetical protein [Variibacter gotjawalensis]RZS47885.1 hypothetical protein EV661_0280 [Variibacter gotjawalensis]BAT60141.1 hypothetical protein GJW-30_1_02677 [Variibacter gotjawalensis]
MWLSRLGRETLTLRMTLAATLLLGGFAVTATPRGVEAIRLIAAQDEPETITDIALAKAFDAGVAQREIEDALKADDAELAQSFLDLADDQHVVVTAALRRRVEDANTTSAQALRASTKFVEGFVAGQPDDLAGLAGTVTGDLLIYGDIRDIVRETGNYARGEKTDELVLGLAAAGLAVTAGTYATLGAGSAARVGVSVTKAAAKTGRMSAKLVEQLARPLRTAIDMPALKAAFGPTAILQPVTAVRAGRAAIKTERMQGAMKAFGDLGQVQAKAGTRAALDGLKLAESPKDIAKLSRLAATKGGKTRAVLKVLGRGAIVLAATLWSLASWSFWALFLIVGFVAGLKRTAERLALSYLRRRRATRLRAAKFRPAAPRLPRVEPFAVAA